MLKSFLLVLGSLYLAIAFSGFRPSEEEVQPTTYIYKTVGNLSIGLDVYVPNVKQDRYPLAFVIHGGGYIGGTKAVGCTPQERDEMLARGWCMVTMDYRLSPAALLADMMEDVEDAYAWVHTELVKLVPLDLDSVMVWGSSAGGALSVICGYMLSPRPQVIASLYPGWINFTDPIDYNGTSPVPQILVTEVEALMKPITSYDVGDWGNLNDPRIHLFLSLSNYHLLGWMLASHNPNESAENVYTYLRKYSAVYHVDASFPPTVLIHGTGDTLVPHAQSEEMAEYLAKVNVPHKLFLVPGGDHGFDYKNMSMEVWTDYVLPAFDFIQEHLKTNSTEELAQ